MYIDKPQLYGAHEGAEYRVRVRAERWTEILWYRVDPAYRDLLSSDSDAALVAMLLPAMYAGEDIFVSGRVSHNLASIIAGPLQDILSIVMPQLSRVRVVFEDIAHEGRHAPGIATGFSGGIDSFCTLADYYDRPRAPELRVTHLLFNNLGSHGPGETLFWERYRRLLPAAQRLDLPFIAVNSNLHELYSSYEGLNFLQTHTVRNVSAAMALQNGIGTYLYSSGYRYQDMGLRPTKSFGYSDMVIIPMISTQQLLAVSVGGEYSRFEKTRKVAKNEIAAEFLDVCVTHKGAKNCGRCGKCLRTLLTLDVSGALGEFSAVFDIESYREVRSRFIARCLRSRDPYVVEILDAMPAHGFKVPLFSKLYAYGRGAMIERIVRDALGLPRTLW